MVVDTIIDVSLDESDAVVSHDELRTTGMIALESTTAPMTTGWSGACLERVQRNRCTGQREVGREGTSVGTLCGQRFANHERLAKPINYL